MTSLPAFTLRWTTILVASLCACSASHSNDSGSARGANVDRTVVPDDSELPHPHRDAVDDLDDTTPVPPPTSLALNDEESAWLNATDYEIILQRRACFGTCSVFDASLRSTGVLRFTGYRFVWKPGTYEVPRSTADVAALYAHMIQRGFLRLQPHYVTESDGCPDVWTDNPTSIFTLRAGGREKMVEYYHGCEGDFPVLDTLYEIEREIIQQGDLARFIQGNHDGCYRRKLGDPTELLEPSYVLRDAQKNAVGILRFDRSVRSWRPSWTVSNCDGETLAGEEQVMSWDCGTLLVPTAESTFRWPGSDQPLSAVELTVPYDAKNAHKVELKLVTFDDEITATAARGDSCR